MFKKEVQRLVLLGVLKAENDSEWGAPYFAQPKPKSNQVRFLSDLGIEPNNLSKNHTLCQKSIICY